MCMLCVHNNLCTNYLPTYLKNDDRWQKIIDFLSGLELLGAQLNKTKLCWGRYACLVVLAAVWSGAVSVGHAMGGGGRGGKMTRYDIHTWKSEQKLGGLWNYSSLFQYLHWWMKMLTPMILDNSAPKNSRSEEDFLYCLYHLQYQKPIYIMISVSNVLEKVLMIVFFG